MPLALLRRKWRCRAVIVYAHSVGRYIDHILPVEFGNFCSRTPSSPFPGPTGGSGTTRTARSGEGRASFPRSCIDPITGRNRRCRWEGHRIAPGPGTNSRVPGTRQVRGFSVHGGGDVRLPCGGASPTVSGLIISPCTTEVHGETAFRRPPFRRGLSSLATRLCHSWHITLTKTQSLQFDAA
jgi:hypothetical protein